MELELELQFEADEVDTISITIAEELVQSNHTEFRFQYIKHFCCNLLVLVCVIGILFRIYSIYPTINSQNQDHITTTETNTDTNTTTTITTTTITTIMTTTTSMIKTTTDCDTLIPI